MMAPVRAKLNLLRRQLQTKLVNFQLESLENSRASILIVKPTCLQNDMKLSPYVDCDMFFVKMLQCVTQMHASSKTGDLQWWMSGYKMTYFRFSFVSLLADNNSDAN